tara:strand:- start:1102 stop:2034 length:933 start_codon:yes stop_codon:yes gene_type:complete
MRQPFGFLVIDKPSGLTSHDCIKTIRKVFEIKRVGHGGTLDPDVTGVLPIAIGHATRLLPYLKGSKTYVGSIQLGKRTSTDDVSGEIISEIKFPALEISSLEGYLDLFRGKIKQRPPLISSVKINGERAYKRYRRGEIIDTQLRNVEIYDLKLVNWCKELGLLEIKVDCSSGTYIRSIARDLGNEIGCGGCLAKLRRIQALGFDESQAITLQQKDRGFEYFWDSLLNPIEALKHLPLLKLDNEEELYDWSTGRKLLPAIKRIEAPISNLSSSDSNTKKSILILYRNKIMGIGELIENSILKPKVVFNARG